MKSIPLRVPDELLAAVREKVGKRGVNRLVVGLLWAWNTSEDAGCVREPARLAPLVIEEVPLPKVLKASDLPPRDIPEGAVCAYQVRGGICGAPAVFARGNRYFCQEH